MKKSRAILCFALILILSFSIFVSAGWLGDLWRKSTGGVVSPVSTTKSLCGNGVVNIGENCINCPKDVKCELDEICDKFRGGCHPACEDDEGGINYTKKGHLYGFRTGTPADDVCLQKKYIGKCSTNKYEFFYESKHIGGFFSRSSRWYSAFCRWGSKFELLYSPKDVGDILFEKYCDDKGDISFIFVECVAGCKNGACIDLYGNGKDVTVLANPVEAKQPNAKPKSTKIK